MLAKSAPYNDISLFRAVRAQAIVGASAAVTVFTAVAYTTKLNWCL